VNRLKAQVKASIYQWFYYKNNSNNLFFNSNNLFFSLYKKNNDRNKYIEKKFILIIRII